MKRCLYNFLISFIYLATIPTQAAFTIASAELFDIQSQGSNFIVSGCANINGNNSGMLARYTSLGSVDTTFATSGIVALSLGNKTQFIDSTILASDNSIYTTGSAADNSPNLLVAHYSSTGSADFTFGSTGATGPGYTITTLGDSSVGNSIGLQSTGSIIVGGLQNVSGFIQGFVARYTSNGVLDNTFGSNGITNISLNSYTTINDIVIQSDDKIVAVGTTQDAITGINQLLIVRLNSDGSFDNSFGASGIATTSVGTVTVANTVELQSTGAIIAGGSSDTMALLARYTTGGVLDTSFGTNGITTTIIGNKATINGITIDSSDTIYAIGNSDDNCITVHYDSSGNIDTTFGTNGISTIILDSITQGISVAQPTGPLIAAGSITNDIFLLAFNVTGFTGSVNSSFLSSGIVNAPTTAIANNVAFLADKKLSGVNGGTFTSGAWQTRTLNVQRGNHQFVSLSNNQFTLQPGIYSILALAPAFNVGSHQLALQNITTNQLIMFGTNEYAVGSQTRSNLIASLIVTVPQTYSLYHQCSTTQATNGFGVAAGFGSEIYAVAIITKLNF